jgi:hypothetical protein
MKMNEVRARAKDLGITIKVGSTKVDAIRAIQRAEGYEDCFGRGLYNSCGQDMCLFRADCIKIG